MTSALLPGSDEDVQQLASDRARALAAIERWRKSTLLEGLMFQIAPTEHERDALAEAAASLYAKRRARARARRAATGRVSG